MLRALLTKEIGLYRRLSIPMTERDILLVYIISICSGCSLGLLGFGSINITILLGFIFTFLPRLILGYLGQKHIQQFEKIFPEGLSLIANSLRSGFALERCLQLIEKEMPPPLNQEFALINTDLRMGSPLARALRGLEERIPLPQTKLFVTAVIIQQEVGGSLSDIMISLAETVRKNKEIRQELKVLTSQGRTSAMLVGALPFFLLGIIWLISPDYVKPLFTTQTGHILIGASLSLEIIGIMIIMKMLKL